MKNVICEFLNVLSTLVLTINHFPTNLCQSNIPLRKKQLQFIVVVAIMNKTCQEIVRHNHQSKIAIFSILLIEHVAAKA